MQFDYPEADFVRVKLGADNGHEYSVTFTVGDDTPVADNAIIRHVEEQAPDQAEQLKKLLTYLKSHEERFFDWLKQSPANGQLFAEQPLQALRQALPQAPLDN
ncbi:MAG: hypothetical protein Tsb002_15710 [Wenzhouxiangellaceae bacterium]